MRTWRRRKETLGVLGENAKRHKIVYIAVNNKTNLLKILFIYTIWNGLSPKTAVPLSLLSRNCVKKSLCWLNFVYWSEETFLFPIKLNTVPLLLNYKKRRSWKAKKQGKVCLIVKWSLSQHFQSFGTIWENTEQSWHIQIYLEL